MRVFARDRNGTYMQIVQRGVDQMLKKGLLIVAILFLVLCTWIFLLIFLEPAGNRTLALNEMKALFKPTVHLEVPLNANDIAKISFSGLSLPDTTDQKKIEKLLSYLNKISLAKADRSELPGRSPDATIFFYDAYERKIMSYSFFGEVFILDTTTDQLYRSKHDWVITEIEKLW